MAREAKSQYDQGIPLKEIRENIDKKYENTGVPSTPTPKPE
ncbi:hypothetical protein H1Z61_15590 [Bacillus aquiflavi]|uniref:Uncharacterized protein n=1 Tax=Bacillus aquiflavi TaxID=2672567 RepID=A0A6B3W312_9BACI|nr:hypothetical protein [Bacillus aquiflavi]NEY82877.1 hypothetical protein [Bacillus aquiflavi]UAC50004.1 PCYCGC domain-containing protein [Bacillus aquiflavi]